MKLVVDELTRHMFNLEKGYVQSNNFAHGRTYEH